MINTEELFTLHRYFLWADRMRFHFDENLRSLRSLESVDSQIDNFLYMSYWYGGLYVLIEGWQELNLHDHAIDSLLMDSNNVDLLKRYRHGVFHFQKNYFDKRFIDFMVEGNKCVEWVRNLREAFSNYFLKMIKANGEKSEST